MAHSYSKNCPFASLDDIAGKKITIMGLGLNGGGVASALFFARYGAFVTITDMKTPQELEPSVQKIKNAAGIDQSKIRFVLGTHNIEDFANADCVIKNPGVKFEGNKFLAVSKAIETDLSIFLRFTKAPIIAVTGSKGKSSTVSCIHYALCKAGFNAFLGGNITVSPLTFLEQTNAQTPVVLELSSWQLADLRGRAVLKPHIALITTIVPDHLNWYGTMDLYVQDKKLIYQDLGANDYLFCKANDEWGDVFAKECAQCTKAKIVRYNVQDACSTELLPQKLLVPGKHMRQNVYNAALVLRVMGVKNAQIKEILATYAGIEHRLECFYTHKGLRFFNDSASTVPDASIAALDAFDESVIFIAGGTDKQCNMAQLANTYKIASKTGKLQRLYLLAGTATDKLLPLLNGTVAKNCIAGVYNSLEALLLDLQNDLRGSAACTTCNENGGASAKNANTEGAQGQTLSAKVVVFSPGATSFGMFKNEFDRGNTYKALVQKIFV